MRYAVQQRGEVSGHVGVPRVRVDQVGAEARIRDREVDAESSQRRVGRGQLREVGVRRRQLLVARGTERVHLRLDVAAAPQRPHQLGDVHARAAVHLGWVLPAQHVDSHVRKLPLAVPHEHRASPARCTAARLATSVSDMTGTQRKNVLAIVLAGGEGKRLMPLTADRAKPAVPYAGIYRLIDFALSNVVNSGYLQVVVLTQYKSHSLDRHISQTWRMSTMLGNYVTPVPAQQRVGKRWYLGSADAIFQSLNLVRDEKPDIIVVVGADHIYRMDFSQMVDQHVESGAGCTVAAIRQPIGLADQFGVIDVQPDDPQRIREFLEKPKDPVGLPDSPNEVLASMGNYVFDADALVDAVTSDAMLDGSKHDMGGDIVPAFVRRADAGVYDYKDNVVPGSSERDRGTGATSGRSAPTTPRTWTSSRRCRSSTSTTSAGRSSPPTARSPPPSWSRATATSPRRPATPCSRPASW